MCYPVVDPGTEGGHERDGQWGPNKICSLVHRTVPAIVSEFGQMHYGECTCLLEAG